MLSILLLVVAFTMFMLGILFMVLSMIKESEKIQREDRKTEGGGVIIIGPLPIVIGTSEKITRILIILALLLFIVTLTTFILFTRWF
ncbi:MAG: DUF131 domain-containing protein [Desulfurococcaceae archaeon]